MHHTSTSGLKENPPIVQFSLSPFSKVDFSGVAGAIDWMNPVCHLGIVLKSSNYDVNTKCIVSFCVRRTTCLTFAGELAISICAVAIFLNEDFCFRETRDSLWGYS